MSRKPIIAGNWKMNLLQADAKALFEKQKDATADAAVIKLLLQVKTATGKSQVLSPVKFLLKCWLMQDVLM